MNVLSVARARSTARRSLTDRTRAASRAPVPAGSVSRKERTKSITSGPKISVARRPVSGRGQRTESQLV